MLLRRPVDALLPVLGDPSPWARARIPVQAWEVFHSNGIVTMVMTMVTVSKSALKARMLEYFRKVEQTGEELIVTSAGRPVLRVVPYLSLESVSGLFADVRDRLTFSDDPDAPTSDEWRLD